MSFENTPTHLRHIPAEAENFSW